MSHVSTGKKPTKEQVTPDEPDIDIERDNRILTSQLNEPGKGTGSKFAEIDEYLEQIKSQAIASAPASAVQGTTAQG
ncbi:hypothetical protein PENNAL_c0024G01384 [Penicillium nalgiovense]|uniref:Uncharacterized protein n=1 Tax=Penicillium nalgiovense TaxID=60175 RepID=A0A1V6YD95_PENNA|nr:hypothetical protein PENNAL_c0024G01384 [Penicillium nalgiovense]